MFNIRAFLGLNFYVSKLDQFLKHFNKTHPTLSESQQQEIKKYARVFALRDGISPPPAKEDFWDKF